MRSTLALFALALTVSVPAAAANEPSDYAAALADAQRPAADKERDAARHPAELLAFAEIDPGEKVGDYIMGGGYWTRLLATAVGPQGKVYAFQPDEFIAFRAAYGDEQNAAVAGRANVAALRGPVAAPPFPEKLDTIITVQNLHDLYLGAFPPDTAAKSIAALFDALKPGGTLVVVDHSAADGSGTTAANSIHRIDKAAAIAALTNAGFVVEAQSDLYKRPDDPRTANVFDPTIRGKTDQFALRLRKPN
ncbi:class I SAM-dependent methyltransferase [Altererythrobacter sp. Root672]|uniref:class I SAM-dependent methyltransferase n=1 Tax=Altererythrobacter sp. Root672 TaxID=1736584 RepID=UPI0006FD39F3|nr:class I SAM-dependent methyltransferase [Altererythrobacter sp. Root672]KRA80529.1 methyltransferase [Altererythrobacter sp. Root672]